MGSSAAVAGDEWSRDDTVRQLAVSAVLLADWSQSRYIAKHPGEFYEKNGTLGRHPSAASVDRYFAGTLVVAGAGAAILPRPYREAWQYGWFAVEAWQVVKNRQVHVGFSF